jgi:replication factor C subunit 3/5
VICGRHSTFFRFFIRILITMDFSSPLGLCISHLSELEHEMSVSFECGWVQSGQMASPHLTAEAVYLCTGNPMPKDIEQIAFWLLNESFSTSYQKISEMKTRKGLALFDVVQELQPFVFSIDMPPAVRIQLIDALADIEYRLAFGPNEKLQLGALLSAFTHARTTLVAAAQ